MTDRIIAHKINDIAWQAHQGSVAAIIQLLNQKLAKTGVRTRAMFSDGVLQLLCEASKVEQLEQSTLVPQIKEILESTAPRNIHRVNINSRIVREDQLLWLREINRDRENQLLWSEEVKLAQPNIFKQIIQDLTEVKNNVKRTFLIKAQSSLIRINQNKNSHTTEIQAVLGLSLLLLLGWLVYALLDDHLKNILQLASLSTESMNAIKAEVPHHTTNKSFSPPSEDPFAASVRIANQATTYGKTATTSTQLLELAAKWQRASDLMGAVPPSHSRYEEAKIRTQLYKKYSEAAQKEASKSKL